ncbi:MAG TPA: Do family serine endopeptidase [Gammaproteobacteria bacterium]|nr:Do family serine endopeptidase [Gammaproteobacteria bacterium]
MRRRRRRGYGRRPAIGAPAFLLAFVLVAANWTLPAAAQDTVRQGRRTLDQVSAAFEQAAAKVNPSVVPIFSVSSVSEQDTRSAGSGSGQLFGGREVQPGYGEMPHQEQRVVHSLGSGVIASPDGYILTNNHVVEGARELTVVLPNGQRLSASIVGADPETDLALVKVDAHNLPAASFGDSDDVKIGQWVIAVGNPFELLHTTTAGIVSATGRSHVGITDYEDFIQTDAAVNPGNSGGALADLDGKVIGINAAISSPTGGSVGLGFAIPVNMAKTVMAQLKAHGRVIRGYLGVLLQPLTSDLASALGMAQGTKGVLIGDVEHGSPADHAGLKRGDVVMQFDGRTIDAVESLRDGIASSAPGSRVQLGVLRNGKSVSLDATLAEQAQSEKAAEQASSKTQVQPPRQRLGLVAETLTPDIAQQLGYAGEQGAIVVRVAPGGVAESVGLERGDLIKEVDRQAIRSADELAAKVLSLKSGPAALLVQRSDKTFFVAIRVP